ncbi:MAG: IS21 family transposase [Myxococcota bacterium]
MPAERLPMRKLREIFRLHFEMGLSGRAIARSCNLSSSTVLGYLGRAKVAQLSWPQVAAMDDTALNALLFPNENRPVRARPEPDFALVHLELKRKHVTKMLLWQEYREQHPDGYQYSQFCEHYNRWASSLHVTMRQTHRAGEKVFVDFSGDGISIVDPRTGECHTAKLFVAVLGASNFTYVEPVLNEQLPTWISCHVNAFNFFGGVPEIVVPDNLKSGVTKPDFYDPDVNPTYADLAQHYTVAVIPARKRKPRDKAKAEQGVLLAERWIIAALRHREFTSLAELREAIRPLVEKLNTRRMQKVGKSRREVFETIEKPALRPLPSRTYELCEWRKVSVNIDYHIEYDEHYYSVHYTHYSARRRKMEVRATASTVEVLYGGRVVVAHVRSYEKFKHTTLPAHMPDSHRRNLEWPPSRIIAWAKTVGPCTAQVVEEIMKRRQHPEQGYRSSLGGLRLRDRYPDERIERACEIAIQYRSFSRRSIEATLKNNRDRIEEELSAQRSLPLHKNVRGGDYYH